MSFRIPAFYATKRPRADKTKRKEGTRQAGTMIWVWSWPSLSANGPLSLSLSPVLQLGVQKLTRSGLSGVSERDF